MINAVLNGQLHDLPQKKQTQAGKPYATAKLRTPAHDGSTMFVNVITFDKFDTQPNSAVAEFGWLHQCCTFCTTPGLSNRPTAGGGSRVNGGKVAQPR